MTVEAWTSRHRGAAVPERSLLRLHARWILAVTLVAVASACLLAWVLQPQVYRSEARVVVNPAVTPGGAPLPPDMETERQVAVSGAVTSDAAEGSGTSARDLQKRLTVSVPADSTVLVIDYADTTALNAQKRAQAIADAYIAYRAPQAAILDAASTPRSTTGPNYLLDAAAALVVGLLLGMGSAPLRDRLDDHVRGPGDFIERAQSPVLASVPLTMASPGEDFADLVILTAPNTPAAEAYRRVRAKVVRAARARDRSTVTLVTSASDDDGAAEVAANTAAALALAGGRVLLIETDLRNSRLTDRLNAQAAEGLGGVLDRGLSLSQVVRDTPVDRLGLLVAGEDLPTAPGELFTDGAVEKLLREVPDDVEHVIVFAPPVLGAVESCVLAQQADLVLFVAALGRTNRRDLTEALAELGDVGAPIFGGVLCRAADRARHGKRRGNGRGAEAPAAEPIPDATGPGADGVASGSAVNGRTPGTTEDQQGHHDRVTLPG